MKQNRKIPLLVGGAIVLAIVAGTFLQRGRDRAIDAAPDVEQAAAAPATTLPGSPPPPAAVGSRAADPTDARERFADHMASRSQRREQHAARTRELREQSEQRFASEQVDPAWAPQKESELNAIADRPEFGVAAAQPKSLSVDCRSSMCRIDGQFETNGQAEDWILMYMSSVGSGMPNSVVSRSRNPDGSTRVQIYGRGR